MKSQFFTNCLVALVATMVAATAVSAGEHMAYKYDEGYSQSYKVKFSFELDFGGFAQSRFMDMEVTESCVGVGDDGFMMRIVFDKIEGSQMMMGQTQQDEAAAALQGQAVTFSVSQNGTVEDIKPDGFIEGWDAIKQLIEGVVDSWYVYLPGEDVDEGGEWNHADVDTTDTGMILDSNDSFTYKEKKETNGEECFVIEGKSETELGGGVETQMGTMAAEGSTKAKLKLFLSCKTRTVIKMKMSGETRLDMTDSGGNVRETTINQSVEREAI